MENVSSKLQRDTNISISLRFYLFSNSFVFAWIIQLRVIRTIIAGFSSAITIREPIILHIVYIVQRRLRSMCSEQRMII